MIRRLLGVLAVACTAWGQPPAFEVASVKPAEPITPALVQSGRLQIGVTIDSLHVRISQLSLLDLTRLAFQVKAHQVTGAPWMATERYDIQARLPEGGKRGQVPAMLQSLLAERFAMQLHRETREFKVYALTVAKGGPRLTPSPAEEAAPEPQPGGQIRGGLAVGPGGAMTRSGPGGNSQVTPGPGGNLHIAVKKMTMEAFADLINRYCDQPVVDMTELKGNYDLEIDISGEEVRNAARAHGASIPPSPAGAPGDASEPAGVSLASSLEKLGLKLEGRKAPAEVIVIDKAERVPTQN
jgi:uncharacterized protein (TIGR03435 family)